MSVTTLDPAEVRAAALTICHHALDRHRHRTKGPHMNPDERLQLAADVLAWTKGYDCTDDDAMSAGVHADAWAQAAKAVAHIDGARGMSERTVFVPGLPQAQGNMIKGRWGGTHDTNKNLLPWREAIIARIHESGWQPILHGAITVTMLFVLPRPKRHYGTGRNAGIRKAAAPLLHTKAPDADKLQRSVGDALTQSGVIRDDAQIAVWTGRKEYTSEVHPMPGLHLTIEAIGEGM